MKKLILTLLLLIPSLSWGEHKFGEYEKDEKEFIEDVKDNDSCIHFHTQHYQHMQIV